MSSESPRAEDMRMDVSALLGAVLSRWLRIVIVTLVLLGATYAALLLVPKLYESSASILVEARDNAFTGPTVSSGSGGGAAITIDAMVSSQIELIKSRDTLLKVVDAVNLRSIPEFNGSGPNPLGLVSQLIGRKAETRSVDDTVLQNLNDRLTVIRERDSAIISIFVRAQNPQLAANIANAIASEHVKRRADQSLTDTAEASTWLEQEIVKLRQRVTDAETAVAKFRSENDLFEGPNNTSLLDQQLSNIATQITAAQERRNAAQTRAALIRGMVDAGQAISGLSDVQGSAAIQQLSQSRADLQGQLAQKSSTLLPNHPTIKALTAQIREIDRQVAAEGKRVAASLESEAKIQADLETSLQGELTRLKQSASSAATHTVTLDELQREAKAQRDLLESYLLRYRDAMSRSDSSSALPDVRVVTLAAASQTPASPKSALILGAVAFAALALQIGAIMFGELLSGRAVMDGRPVRIAPVLEGEREVQPDPDEPLLPFDAPMKDVELPQAAAKAGPQPQDSAGEMTAIIDLPEPEAIHVEPEQPAIAELEPLVAEPAEELEAVAPAEIVETEEAGGSREPMREAAELDEAAWTEAEEEAFEASESLDEPELADEEAIVGEPERESVAASLADETYEPVAALAPAQPEESIAAAEPESPVYEPAESSPIPYLSVPEPQPGRYPSALATLSADIALGRVRVIMIAGLNSADDCLPVADALVTDALHAGLSVVRVDAGSGDVSMDAGVTDLAAERASFGDVVHKGARPGLSDVPWGRQMAFDRRSSKPNTLVEALTDIYEVVLVVTGRVGMSSTLPVFSGIDSRLVLAATGRADPDHVEAALADTSALGFRQAQVITTATLRHAEVA